MNILRNRLMPRQRQQSPAASTDDDSSTICAICCEDSSAAREVARPTVCNHIFCRECLELLCRTSHGQRLCPLDRMPFDKIAVTCREGFASGRFSNKEVVLDAATLAPLQGIFESPTTPVILACILLAVLFAVPSWVLAVHSLALVTIYCVTKGIADFGPYAAYVLVFHCTLVPASFMGFTYTIYTCGACLLMIYCAQGIPALTSRSATPEKLLHGITAVLVCFIYPMTLFSIYTVVQASCYVISVLAGIALCNKLFELYGNKFARTGLLFFSLVFAPYVCQLQHLGLPHLTYTCLILIMSFFLATRETQMNPEFLHLPANLALNFVTSELLGFSPWITMYCQIAVAYAAIVSGLWKFGRLRQAPLLLGINAAVIGCLLPWQLFGIMSYLSCMLILSVQYYLIVSLLDYTWSLPNGHVISMGYNVLVLGMLVPRVLFGK